MTVLRWHRHPTRPHHYVRETYRHELVIYKVAERLWEYRVSQKRGPITLHSGICNTFGGAKEMVAGIQRLMVGGCEWVER